TSTPSVSSAKVLLNSRPPEGCTLPASSCSDADALATKRMLGESNGFGNAMFTVAPIELAPRETSGVLSTVSEPTKSEPTVLKSTERPPAAGELRRPAHN